MDEEMDVEMLDLEQLPLQTKPSRTPSYQSQAYPTSPSKIRKRKVSTPGKSSTPPKTPLPQEMTRRPIRAVRRLPSSTNSHTPNIFQFSGSNSFQTAPKNIYVIDTNILIQHWTDLKKMIERLALQKRLSTIKFVITKTVIDELDFQKKNKPHVNKIVSFVRDHLKLKHFTGEDILIESSKTPSKSIPQVSEVQNNDDKIVRSAELLKKSYEDAYVALVTDDINLHNKCLLRNLSYLDHKDFLRTIMSNEIKPTPSHQVIDEPSSKKKKAWSASSDQAKRVEPVGKKSPSTELSEDAYSSWIKDKEDFAKLMKPFIVRKLKEMYDDIWTHMHPNVDWSNPTFENVINTLKQGWVGGFAECFNRTHEIRDLIEKIQKDLRNELNNCKKLHSDLTLLQRKVKPFL